MKTITLAYFKTHFSEVIMLVKSGTEITITEEEQNEVIGYFLPKTPQPKAKRQLGILEGKASVTFADDFKIDGLNFGK